MTAFQELIAQYRLDRTYRELADDAGGEPAFNAWGEYIKGARLPTPQNVVGVARSLGVTPDLVWHSIGLSHGIPLDSPAGPNPAPLLTGMPPGIDRLSPEDVTVVHGLIRHLLA